MDADKEEAKLEKQYSSGRSSDKSAVCWHYSYDSRINSFFSCLLICHFHDGIILLLSHLNMFIAERFK